MPVFIGTILALSFTSISAAPGEVAVTLENSPDLSVWSSTTTGVKDMSSTDPYFRVSVVPVDGGVPTYSDVVTASTTYPGNQVAVTVESGTDLLNWQAGTTGIEDISGGKKFYRVRAETAFTEFITVDGGSLTDPSVSVDTFIIGLYEVTLEEWVQVYDWAIVNGYDFSGAHDGCDLNHPVHSVSWYDVAKWCNAKSEKEGLTPAYYTDAGQSTVYRTGNVALTASEVDGSATGYRLPTSDEWQFAARGGNSSGGFTYSGSNTANDVAVYTDNSLVAPCDISNLRGTFSVGSKAPNELGTYDMSGNLWEWVFDAVSTNRVLHGGSFVNVESVLVTTSGIINNPTVLYPIFGFRLAMNAPPAETLLQQAEASSRRPGKAQKMEASKKKSKSLNR